MNREDAIKRGITKMCCCCGKEKELTEFHKYKLGLYGSCYKCKACRKAEFEKTYVPLPKKHKHTYTEALEQRLPKKCKCCGKYLTVDMFDKNKYGVYGTRPNCKKCRSLKSNNV